MYMYIYLFIIIYIYIYINIYIIHNETLEPGPPVGLVRLPMMWTLLAEPVDAHSQRCPVWQFSNRHALDARVLLQAEDKQSNVVLLQEAVSEFIAVHAFHQLSEARTQRDRHQW